MNLRFVLVAALVFTVVLPAQDYRARVQGIVTDASDAAVVGATVTLRNNGTGVTATRASGDNGAYLFDNVEPGTYTVTAEFPGFSRQVQENILVQTRGDVTVNFTLKPGPVVETVTVAPSIRTGWPTPARCCPLRGCAGRRPAATGRTRWKRPA